MAALIERHNDLIVRQGIRARTKQPTMRLSPPLLFIAACLLSNVCARTDLVLENDVRKIILISSFGFLPGGVLTLNVSELSVSRLAFQNVWLSIRCRLLT